MKKLTAFLMVLITVFSMAACSTNVGNNTQHTTEPETTVPETTEPVQPAFSVYKPMAYPDYTFDAAPTNAQLRQMAVQAMIDYLSVQWDVASGKARCFEVSEFAPGLEAEMDAAMESGRAYTLRLDVTVTNGEVFTPAKVTVTKA